MNKDTKAAIAVTIIFQVVFTSLQIFFSELQAISITLGLISIYSAITLLVNLDD